MRSNLSPAAGARRLPRIALTLLVGVSMLAASACGSNEEKTSGMEGEFIKAGEAVYQVQLTRLLNPRIRPDDTLLRGQPPPPADQLYLAVFLKIKNKGDAPYSAPRDMKVVDTVGNEYLPLDATQSGFGLDFAEPLKPGEAAPPPNSPAAEGPSAGAMVLFRVKEESATDNLPLELEIPTGSQSSSRIRLDV
jgi:hypothetical protein